MIKNENLNPEYLKKINLKYQLTLRGKYLLDTADYNQATDFYTQLLEHPLFINDYHPYTKLAKAYHELRNYKAEVETIENFFKSGRYCQRTTLRWFKRRLGVLSDLGFYDIKELTELESFFEKNGLNNVDKSRQPVPLAYDIKKARERNNNKVIDFGSEFFDDYLMFDVNSSLEYMIKFKYKLFRKGEELIANKEFFKAIVYFKKLISHDLFVNDYYPHQRLSQIYKITKQESEEINVLLDFLSAGIYCNDKHLNWFINRLTELCELGFYDLKLISQQKEEFNKKGALNKHLTNIPVPTAIKIRNAFKYADGSNNVDENSIIGILIDEVPEEYVNKLPNQLLYINENANIGKHRDKYYTLNLDDINMTERKQMIIVLQALQAGMSRSNAAKIAGCSAQKVYGWFDDGKNLKSTNTIYFYTQSSKIEKSRKNNDETLEDVEIENLIVFNDNNIEHEEKLIQKFNDYIKSSYYKIDAGEFMLSLEDVEEIKNNIVDDIVKHDIEGETDFKSIFIEYCKKFNIHNPQLSEDEFNEIFSSVEIKGTVDVDKIKSRIVNEYNSNKIRKVELKSRFEYYIQRSLRQSNQISRLEDIKQSNDVPEIKRYLTSNEQNEIYDKTERKILSDHGLNSIVLDYIRFKMYSQVEENKSEAKMKLDRFSKEGLFSKLDDNQTVKFIKELKLLIDKHRIKKDDITKEYVEKLTEKYLNSHKIIL